MNDESTSEGRYPIIPTGISELNYILGGGFKAVGNRYPSVLIRGPAGAGKSILCSLIARHFLLSIKKSVAYLSLDQSLQDTRRLFNSFGPSIDDRIVDASEPNKPTGGAIPTIMVRQYRATVEAARHDVNSKSRHLPAHDWVVMHETVREDLRACDNLGLVVIDSLFDAIREDNDAGAIPFSVRRTAFLGLCNIAAAIHKDAIVLIALETAKSTNWRDFVADVVLELGQQEIASSPGVTQRYLSVVKTRHQPALSGKHLMQIDAKNGILLFPSLSATLARETETPMRLRAGKELFSCNPSFNSFLSAGGQDASLLPGQNVLLYGSDATRKNAVAVSFLRQGLVGDEQNAVLYLAVDSAVAVSRQMILGYIRGRDSQTVTYPSPESVHAEHIMKRIDTMAIGGYNEPPEVILKAIRQRINETERPVTRVVLNDVAALHPRQSDLIPVLKELFSSRGISSVFLHTVPEGKDSEYRESFDSFIMSRHLELPNQSAAPIAYRVLKWNGSTRTQRSWELYFDEVSFEMLDSFRYFVQDVEGRLHLLKLELQLHFPFKGLSEFWRNAARVVHGYNQIGRDQDAPILNAFGREESQEVFESIRTLPSNTALLKTVVISFDEPWADEFIVKKRLQRLDELDGGREFVKQVRNTFNTTALSTVDREDGLYGIPHHLDLGFYTVNLKWLQKTFKTAGEPRTFLVGERKLAINKSWTWDDIQYLDSVASEKNVVRELRTFGYSVNDIEESSLCFILEILWPFMMEVARNRRESCLSMDPSILEDPLVVQAIVRLHSHLESLGAQPFQWVSKTTQPLKQAAAIIERHWYVSYRERMLISSGDENNLVIIPPPSLVIPAAKDMQHQAKSIRGDWYLGVVNGSVNPRRGLWAINALTSEAANRRIFSMGLGLPALKALLQFGEGREYAQEYEGTVSRRHINNYQQIRSVLIDGFKAIFTSTAEAERDGGTELGSYNTIERTIKQMLSTISASTSAPNQ